MAKKEELDQKILFFYPEVVFDSTIGGVKLVLEADAFNGHITWIVYEGDYCTEFNNFPDARDYYLVAIGCE